MAITITLTAADGATDTLSLAEPTVNPAGVTLPFSNQMLIFNGQALDATNGTLALTTPTGSPGQLWTQQTDATSGITYLQPGTGWFAIDFTTNPLAVGVPWLNTASGNSCIVADDGVGISIEAWVPSANAAQYLAGTTMQTASYAITLQGQTQPPPPPAGTSYAPSTYVKVFEDTFTQTSLDTTKWWTRMAGDDGLQQNISSNGELELYSESNNHVMTGSSVKLTAYPPAAGSSNYLSGMLRCKQAFHVASLTTSFYIEVVCKIPNATGSWPAFWFSAEPTSAGVTPPWPPEADAFEFMNNGTTNSFDVHMSTKENGNVPGPWNALVGSWDAAHQPAGWVWNADGDTKWLTTVDFSQEFHTFACQFAPGAAGTNINPATGEPTHIITYYIDGWAANILPYDFQMGADGSSGWNAELLLNLAVGGFGGGTPNPAEYPCAFEIQRVSVFLSQEDSTALVQSVVGQDLMPPTGG